MWHVLHAGSTVVYVKVPEKLTRVPSRLLIHSFYSFVPAAVSFNGPAFFSSGSEDTSVIVQEKMDPLMASSEVRGLSWSSALKGHINPESFPVVPSDSDEAAMRDEREDKQKYKQPHSAIVSLLDWLPSNSAFKCVDPGIRPACLLL